MIIACYASNIFCLVASMMVCVNGMWEILGPNWLRVGCLAEPCSILCFRKKWGTPIAGWFIVENTIQWMIGGYPYDSGNRHVTT